MTRIKLPPFIVTLGTLGIFTAITLIYAKGQTVSLNPNSFVLWTGKTHALGSFDLSNGVILMVLVYIVVSFVFEILRGAEHLYATGDDAEAARLAGIRTDRVILSAYMVAGAHHGDRGLDPVSAGSAAVTRTAVPTPT